MDSEGIGLVDSGVSSERKPTLFPLFQSSNDSSVHGDAQWLTNASFTSDLSVLQKSSFDSVADGGKVLEKEGGGDEEKKLQDYDSFEYLDELVSDHDPCSDAPQRPRKRKTKAKSRIYGSNERSLSAYGLSFRKPNVRSWENSDGGAVKSYYFDSMGDRDNLAFGCLYRMDIVNYKLYYSSLFSGCCHKYLYRSDLGIHEEIDMDYVDKKLKSEYRYCSAHFSQMKFNRSLKRLQITTSENPVISEHKKDFIPMSDLETLHEIPSYPCLVAEESWEEEALRKTREFNRLTRERPNDENVWLSFAEFQDKVSGMQPQKGARLQTLEKKISILERSVELNPENESLILQLMGSYQKRDSSDALFDRWEKVLMKHSGNYRLWKEFLLVVQGEFSSFKVTKLRKLYSHSIQALATAKIKLHRQVGNPVESCKPVESLVVEQDIVQIELGMVDILASLCRLEWQAGYRELATALMQAECEYSLFSPSLFLTEMNKKRLFEYFWNSEGRNIGEEGALGWSSWLEKTEGDRQKLTKEENFCENENTGWTGWYDPLLRNEKAGSSGMVSSETAFEGLEEAQSSVEDKHEDDTRVLLTKLGIDDEAEVDFAVKNVTTWMKWSEEELSRDSQQWLPLSSKSAEVAGRDDAIEEGPDEQFTRVVLFEDVSGYIFSLISEEARFYFVCEFIRFFGGSISHRLSTNCLSWKDRILGLEVIPEFIFDDLKRVHDVFTGREDHSSITLKALIENNSQKLYNRNEMLKFLRNAILLCLDVFPRNYVLEEAVLVAEELSNSDSNSSNGSVVKSRCLAKRLLKSDRQDILLCGVYARREAAFGNINQARRIFDMALSSVERPQLTDSKTNLALLYFWYAEMELENGSYSSESVSRGAHVLCFLGSGDLYNPYREHPSNLLILRARQGFKDRINVLQSLWVRGIIEDTSVALVCSAALLEELTLGMSGAVAILTNLLSHVLPEKRSQTYNLELVHNFSIKMLCRHQKESKFIDIWSSLMKGLSTYPSSPKMLCALLEVGHLHLVPSKLRRTLDYHCHKNPSVMGWLFTLSYELYRRGCCCEHRIRGLFEKAVGNAETRCSVLLWRAFIMYEVEVTGNLAAAKRIYFRAIQACPWSKRLWLDAFEKLSSVFTVRELSDFHEVMRDKELNIRTDVYEILLREEEEEDV